MTQKKDSELNPVEAPNCLKTTVQKTLIEQQAQIQRMRATKVYNAMRTEDGDYKIKLRSITKIIRCE